MSKNHHTLMFFLLTFSFIAGIVTVLSPCILPILPIILTSSIPGKMSSYKRPLGVVTGFILSFTFFTLFLSTLVKVSGISANALRHFSVIVIALFGVSLLIPRVQHILEAQFSKLSGFLPAQQRHEGFYGGLIIGLSVGLLWTPCVGPILASVISLALTGTVTLDTLLITLAYATGTAIPMFFIILGGQNALRRVPWLLSHLNTIRKIFGILMILTALGIFFNFDRNFQAFVLDKFPKYGSGLTKVEDNARVRQAIDRQINGNESTTIDDGKMNLDDLMTGKGKVAPELIPGGQWFNSTPLTLKSLRGKVVIVDFWTYTCINCQRTFPYLRMWQEKYKDDGLVIIGVHSPEFEFEKSAKNLKKAIDDFGIIYPVVQDNNFATWKAYENQYWPAKYFVDKEGYIRSIHYGEGGYNESETVIQELLNESSTKKINKIIDNKPYEVNAKTPEKYLGYGRIEGFASNELLAYDKMTSYTAPKNLHDDEVAYAGTWKVTEEYAQPQKGAKLTLNFEAKEVFLVMRPEIGSAKVKVLLDGKELYLGEDVKGGSVTVDADRLYKLVNLEKVGEHVLELEFQDDNAELFAFTFG